MRYRMRPSTQQKQSRINKHHHIINHVQGRHPHHLSSHTENKRRNQRPSLDKEILSLQTVLL
eukprot:29592_3